MIGPMNDRPVTPTLASRLSQLVAQARTGDAAFASAAAAAERAAAAPVAPERRLDLGTRGHRRCDRGAGPTRIALADIDEIGATALRTQGGIAPNDLAAIKNRERGSGCDRSQQAARIKALQRQLGL